MKNVFLHGLKSYINNVCLREARKSSEHIPPSRCYTKHNPIHQLRGGGGACACINLYLIMFIKCGVRRVMWIKLVLLYRGDLLNNYINSLV